MLGESAVPLVDAYDLVMLDLDGVVYVGQSAVPDAPARLEQVRASGVHLAFVTNNASRPPSAVVEKLRSLGVTAGPGDVVTAAQAAATVLLEQHGEGAAVAVLGATGLREALTEAGLRPVPVSDEGAVALVTGYGPDVVWHEVMEAAVRIREGLPWVATNTDLTLPTPTGLAPGHGALVGLLSRFAELSPVVAGKPEPPLLRETIRRVGGERPLMVGDRLDTDIEGAHRAGVDSLLVLTGVTGMGDLVSARPELRPTYLSGGLEGLLEPHPAPQRSQDRWCLGGWTAALGDGRLDVTGQGAPSDWWRTVAAAAWHHLDETGEPADTAHLVPLSEASGR